MPVAFATPMIREATSRTWPTEPGAPVSSAACSVCTESMTQTSGRSASIVARTVARSVSARTGTCSAASPRRSARRRICAGDSSPDTYSVERPAPARCPSAIPVRVDLPIPGEPPSSTSDPGTSPPPSTRSNSPMPVGSRGRRSERTSASRPGAPRCPRRASPRRPRPGATPPRACSTRRSRDTARASAPRRARSRCRCAGCALSPSVSHAIPGTGGRACSGPGTEHTRHERRREDTDAHTHRQCPVARGPPERRRHAEGRREVLRGPVHLQVALRGGRGDQPRGAHRRGAGRVLLHAAQRDARGRRPHARQRGHHREGGAAHGRRGADHHEDRAHDRGQGPGDRRRRRSTTTPRRPRRRASSPAPWPA